MLLSFFSFWSRSVLNETGWIGILKKQDLIWMPDTNLQLVRSECLKKTKVLTWIDGGGKSAMWNLQLPPKCLASLWQKTRWNLFPEKFCIFYKVVGKLPLLSVFVYFFLFVWLRVLHLFSHCCIRLTEWNLAPSVFPALFMSRDVGLTRHLLISPAPTCPGEFFCGSCASSCVKMWLLFTSISFAV